MAYRYSQDERFLATALRTANYFIDHLPADHIPYWDFDAPKIPDEPRDASAAAIAANGLLELSTYVKDETRSRHLWSSAESLLQSLASDHYLSVGTASRGITMHSVTSRPANIEVDVTLIYADYYLLEALLKYRRLSSGQ
jgi:unsaturated chondroitin disaccharide hydrolase